jgi:hypothetical protein
MSLRGEVAIVTAGTTGPGAALSLALAEQGCHVVSVYAGDHGSALALADRVRALGRSISIHAGDVRDPEFSHQLVRELVEVHGRLDHLLHGPCEAADCSSGLPPDCESLAIVAATRRTMLRQGSGRILHLGRHVPAGTTARASWSAEPAAVATALRLLQPADRVRRLPLQLPSDRLPPSDRRVSA